MKQVIRDKAIQVLVSIDDAVVEEFIKQPNTARLLDVHVVDAVSSEFCAVCSASLLGNQTNFCAAHWDYLLVDWDASTVGDSDSWLGFPTPGFVLEEHARGLEIIADLYEGEDHCEVCDHSGIVTESVINRNGVVLKHHVVCTEHVFVAGPIEPESVGVLQ